MLLAELVDERQQDVHRRFVRPDQDAPPLQIAQVADRRFRLLGQAHQALRVVEQHPARLGELAVLRRTVEQAFAKVFLEPANGLADGRLRPMQPGGRPGKAPLRRNGQKYLKFSEIHDLGRSAVRGRETVVHSSRLCFRNDYKFD